MQGRLSALVTGVPPATVPEARLRRPDDSEMAPPGYIRVNGYQQTRAGKSVLVHSYLRRLPAKHSDRLSRQNLLHIYWSADRRYPKLKDIIGFPKKGSEFDPVIQFWLDYWAERRILPKGIDPLLIKALISLESGFDPFARPPQIPGKKRSAVGLMQLLSDTLRIMAGEPDEAGFRELKKNCLNLTSGDLFDPVLNVAAGIRWLAHKYSQIPKGNPKSFRNMIKNYNGWNKGGDEYAKEIYSRYEKSK